MVYTLSFFSLQNAVRFIILTYLVLVLFTFYIQGVLKFKKNNSGAKRLSVKLLRSSEWQGVIYFRNARQSHCTSVKVTLLRPIKKGRPSLRPFPRSSHVLNVVICTFIAPNVTQIGRQSEKHGRKFRYAPNKSAPFQK